MQKDNAKFNNTYIVTTWDESRKFELKNAINWLIKSAKYLLFKEWSLSQKTFKSRKRNWAVFIAHLRQALIIRTIAKETTYTNLTTVTGRNVIAKWLTGDNTYDADSGCNYCEIGDDNTAPTVNDTSLGNGEYRVATSGYDNNQYAYISSHFPAGTVGGNGPFYEAGLFIDGTSTLDTGQMFSHFAISEDPTANQSITIDSTITISDQ